MGEHVRGLIDGCLVKDGGRDADVRDHDPRPNERWYPDRAHKSLARDRTIPRGAIGA